VPDDEVDVESAARTEVVAWLATTAVGAAAGVAALAVPALISRAAEAAATEATVARTRRCILVSPQG
jgi:hypothetical protein